MTGEPQVPLGAAEIMIGILVFLFGSGAMVSFGGLMVWGYMVTRALKEITSQLHSMSRALGHCREEHTKIMSSQGHIEQTLASRES